MFTLDLWFRGLLELAVISFLVLAMGAVITWRLKQPIERLRAIQWTFAALIAALIARQSALLPPLTLRWLPATETIEAAANEPMTLAADNLSSSDVVSPAMVEPMQGLADANVKQINSPEIAASQPAPQPLVGAWTQPRVLLPYICITVVALGAAWFAVLWVAGRWQLARLLRAAKPVSESLLADWPHYRAARGKKVGVFASDDAMLPMTFGVWRPVIIVPAQFADAANRGRLYDCLSHEFAHIRNGDNATWCVVRLVQPLLWFQPIYWSLRRELRLCQDHLADHFATYGTENRADYAELLLTLARLRLQANRLPALTMAGRPSTVRRRVELLLTDQFALATSVRRSVMAMFGICMIGVVIALGTVQLGRAAAEADEPAIEESNAAKDADTNAPAENPSQPPAADNHSLAFSGTVVDKDSKQPIAGAKVVVRRMLIRRPNRRIIEESEHVTDANGVYNFVIPPEQVAERRLYIELDVEHPDYAWKKGFGYALTMIRKNLELGDPPFFSRIELNPAEPITGRVVDPNGQPLPNVKMLAYSKVDPKDWEDYGSFFRTETDAEGRFRISAAKGGPCVAWIVPEEFAPVQLVLGTKNGDLGDSRVEAGISLSGRVLSATGEPVAGVWVNLEDDASQAEIQMPVASAMRRSAQTNENGEFKLRPMKPAMCDLVVEGYPNEINYHERVRNPVELKDIFARQKINLTADDANRPITIQAVPHVEFQAQYMDSKGQPNPGHDISIYGQLGGQWFHQMLHPDEGGKIVGRLPHGLEKAKLEASTNEHSSLHVRLKKDGPLLGPRDIDLGTIEGDVTGIEIIRYKAPIVQVTVVDEQGKKIPAAKVAGTYKNNFELMHPVGGAPTHFFFEKQSDGRFRTSQMLPNIETTFSAEAEGYEKASETVSLPEEAEKEVTLVLKKSEGKATEKSSDVAEAEITGRFIPQ